MNAKTDDRCVTVMNFLNKIAANNNRAWFQANRPLYKAAHTAFDDITTEMIARISEFDASVSHLTARDCTYRIYRDVRFTNDKRPYKIHMGAYINAMGKKTMHGGYYFHFQPGNCFIAGGDYYLEPNVLKAVRQSIVDNIDEFRAIVEAPEFYALFKEIGLEHIKTVPQGFPKDFPYMQYLRPKDYCASTYVSDDFFLSADWAEHTAKIFRMLKPFLDFVNYTIDDYI